MRDDSQAFYFQYGNQYRPQMYYESGKHCTHTLFYTGQRPVLNMSRPGCRGGQDPAPVNQCCERGQYQSYMIVDGND